MISLASHPGTSCEGLKMNNTMNAKPLTPPPDNTPQPTVPVSPKPRLCIKRMNDTYVPLIAVDELPSWIVLKGVPMVLRGEDVLGFGMMNCGDHPKISNDYYQVELNGIPGEIHACNVSGDFEADDSSTSQASRSTTGRTFVAPDKFADGSKSKINSIQAAIGRVPERSKGTPGIFGKKHYCSYWFRTGNCNYMQEGCKFSHEIPEDEETRIAMGFRTFPTWMRDDPTPPPLPPKPFQPIRVPESNWRRGEMQNKRRESARTTKYNSGRTSSNNLAASVRSSVQRQMANLAQASTTTMGSVSQQIPDPRLPNLGAVQQSGYPLPHQRYPQSSTNPPAHNTAPTQPNSLNVLNSSRNVKSVIPDSRHSSPFQSPTNELFGNAIILNPKERYPSATQPPIGPPSLGDRSLNTYLGSKSSIKPMYTPSESTISIAPQKSVSANPVSQANADVLKANDVSSNNSYASFRSTARVQTPTMIYSSTASTGSAKLLPGSTASPPVQHRRMFVSDGQHRFAANSTDAASSKPHPRSKKGGIPKSRAHGGKGNQSSKDHTRIEALVA